MSSRSRRTIYVGDLPGDIREREVEDLFYKIQKMSFESLAENTSNTQSSQPPCTMQGRQLKSQVWQYMDREKLPNGDIIATCRTCKNVFNASSGSDTSHLKRHLDCCLARPDRSMTSHLGDSPSLSLRTSASFEEIRKSITIFIVAGAHPFSICEEPAFQHMLSTMCPQFSCVSRHTIRREALNYYNEEKHLIRNELQNVPGRISFTTDNWRSENTGDEFMCITAHWIDHNWKLQKRIINFKALVPPFDVESLAEEVKLCLGQWKIDHKVFSFTLDNASYNDTMIASLGNHLLRKHALLIGGQFFHLRCSCHIINLVVQAGLRVIDDVVFKIRSIVKHLKHSIPKRKFFYEIARTSYGLSATKRLRGDNPIRWDSTYVMLDRFLYFKEVIEQEVGKDKDIKMFGLSEVEWEKVLEIHSFLKIFYDVTNTFSSSKTPTSNVYFYGVWRIHRKILQVAFENPDSCLFSMTMDMQDKFNKYWSDYSLILSCAAVLDPRFKLEGVEYCYEKLCGETYAKEMVNSIKSVLLELFNAYRGVSSISTSNVGPSNISTPDAIREDDVVRCFGSPNEASDFQAFLAKRRRGDNEKTELELYLGEQVNNNLVSKDVDVLSYWKNNSERFPCLSSMARDILAIPISTVPSESAFSMGKKLINPWRSSLSSKTIEALACLEDWYRAKGLTSGSSHIFSYGEDVTGEGECEDDEEDVEEREIGVSFHQ